MSGWAVLVNWMCGGQVGHLRRAYPDSHQRGPTHMLSPLHAARAQGAARSMPRGGEPEVVELRETLSNEGEITICSELTCKSGHRIITYIIIAIRTQTTLS